MKLTKIDVVLTGLFLMMSKTMAQLYTNDSIENENDILKFSRDVVELFNMIF